MANESAWVFLLLETCNKLKRSKSDCKRLTWLKYYCILTSLASNSPFTWPTTNLESENISIVFPHIFCTMAIPCNKASYSDSLFVAKNQSLRDFSIIVFSGDIRTSPTSDPPLICCAINVYLPTLGSWCRDHPNRFSIHVALLYCYFYWWFSKFGHQVN